MPRRRCLTGPLMATCEVAVKAAARTHAKRSARVIKRADAPAGRYRGWEAVEHPRFLSEAMWKAMCLRVRTWRQLYRIQFFYKSKNLYNFSLVRERRFALVPRRAFDRIRRPARRAAAGESSRELLC